MYINYYSENSLDNNLFVIYMNVSISVHTRYKHTLLHILFAYMYVLLASVYLSTHTNLIWRHDVCLTVVTGKLANFARFKYRSFSKIRCHLLHEDT